MSARKLRNSWWSDFRFDGIRYRQRSPENSRAGALAYEAFLRQKLARGEPLTAPEKPASKMFKDFVPEWVETYVNTNNKLSERRAKATVLRVHLLPWFGEYGLERINALEIEKYKAAKQKSGLSPKSINNHIAMLIRCLRSACDWGLIPSVPRMALLRVPPQPFDFLSPLESLQLLQDKTEPMWHEMILLALRTGMRRGELFGLEWSHVDFSSHQIEVRQSIVYGEASSPKNNRVRHIPLAPDIAEALLRRQQRRGLVFTRHDGRPLSASIAWNALRRVCKRVRLRYIGWHTLRHTFASQLAGEGAPIYKIQVLMGHATPQMTARYAHLAPSSMRGVIDLLLVAQERERSNLGQQTVNATGNMLSNPKSHAFEITAEKKQNTSLA